MMYVSTRDKKNMVTAAQAITHGLANDGGLFIPQGTPKFSIETIKSMINKSYLDRAVMVLSGFLTDFTEDELKQAVTSAYTPEKFGEVPVPLVQLGNNTAVLELWHGPTSAFKDMALQLLPYLLTMSLTKTGETSKIVILVATSGDTGKAALEGFANVAGTQIIVFYPSEGVSDIQKRQMITQEGNNVNVFGIEGNFDDAQTGVKEIFSKASIRETLHKNGFIFSSANSMNWGRLAPQIVYYFSAYVDAVKAKKIRLGEAINFVVPTGNFGDILAGYYAKLMGLPVGKLICASNNNNVLTDFINTGKYDKNREFYKTTSPSMDILVSSNLERLLYLVSDENDVKTKERMDALKTSGIYEITEAERNAIQEDFFGAWVDEIEVKESIKRVYDDYKYLMDTHTSVGYRALIKYRMLTNDAAYSVVLSTASPFKFSDAVLSALETSERIKGEPFEILHKLADKTGEEIPQRMLELETAPILHDVVIKAADMENTVLDSLVKD
ncbi:MAG: threonine synthase [Phascolarctobacterium sp.]|nr:threonine synthase [Phascolarctobacterium sp.]